MLSYQHIYHAGNLADVHKHSLLAWVLAYLTRKDKPLSYLETHAGRGFYDLQAAEALKTGEAAAGILRAEAAFPEDHPYRQAIAATRAVHGAAAYPGSPAIAAHLLRPTDTLTLAERHKQEHAALAAALTAPHIRVHADDGLALAKSRLPPTPRRGVLLVDPSYEARRDYQVMAQALPRYARVWNVGVLLLWYPILPDGRHKAMTRQLLAACPDALVDEVSFPPARSGHGLIGSGLFVVNPPFGFAEEAQATARRLAKTVTDR